MAQLLGVSPGQSGRVYPVYPARPMSIGRAPGNDIVLDGETSVSGAHARIYGTGGYYTIEDLQSTNGTFVNGQRVAGSAAIRAGDFLQLGQAQLQFLGEAQPPAPLAGNPPAAAYPPGQSYPPAYPAPPQKDRVAAGLLAILLGSLGIHFFYLNKVGWGIAFLLLTVLTCGWAAILTHTVALVQGILYLCATEPDFQQKYVVEGRLF
jgi:TM2 domain-containing membrane protein YozV